MHVDLRVFHLLHLAGIPVLLSRCEHHVLFSVLLEHLVISILLQEVLILHESPENNGMASFHKQFVKLFRVPLPPVILGHGDGPFLPINIAFLHLSCYPPLRDGTYVNAVILISTFSFINEYLKLQKHPIYCMHNAKFYQDESHKFEVSGYA